MIRKNFRAIIPLAAFILIISAVSCDPAAKLRKQEKEQIQEYLSQNSNLNFVKKSSGLYYYEQVAGTGRAPVLHDIVYIKYTAKFLDGNEFDTNVGKADSLKFPFGEGGYVIDGFEEGISYMKEGGKAIVILPSSLAYGPAGFSIVPGYTPLEYDLELVRVKPGSGK
jgi:FKBP-type peptidyl-prolyl cis-trans isomerase FkpA